MDAATPMLPPAPGGEYLTLKLSSLVAGRDLANRLLDGFHAPFTDRAVIIDGSRCSEASASFAAGVVERVLIREGAASLTIAGAPPLLVTTAQQVAEAAGLADRVFVLDNRPTRAQVPA